jgi:hypothetical protein
MLTELNQARNIRFMTVNWFGFVQVWNWCAASAILRKPERLGIWGWFAWTWRQINSDVGIHPVLERQKSWATLWPSTTLSVPPCLLIESISLTCSFWWFNSIMLFCQLFTF